MEKCSFCSRCFEENTEEIWKTESGESVSVPRSTDVYAIADTSLGELTICSDCVECLPDYLTDEDLSSIFYEFSIEYGNREDALTGLRYIKQAVGLRVCADSLAQYARLLDANGDTKAAENKYLEALAIDPDHHMSINNLRCLRKESRNELGED